MLVCCVVLGKSVLGEQKENNISLSLAYCLSDREMLIKKCLCLFWNYLPIYGRKKNHNIVETTVKSAANHIKRKKKGDGLCFELPTPSQLIIS